MKSIHLLTVATAILFVQSPALQAQSLDDLNIQLHGYATEGFLYTSHNNILTTNSSDGSAAWTEAVVNLTSAPAPSLRVAVQGRYSILGNVGNDISLDFAALDYKVSERAGFRAGKVKVPQGLFNETQDIDPSYQWSLLPQGVYPILSRNSLLSLFGGVAYGSQGLGKLGRLEYRAWGGETVLGPTDGFLIPTKDQGLAQPNGESNSIVGGALHWITPIRGLMVGVSDDRNGASTAKTIAGGGALTGNIIVHHFNLPNEFGRLEWKRFMFAAEHSRTPIVGQIQLTGIPFFPLHNDIQAWYAMSTYKITNKLTAGLYDSQAFVRSSPLGPARFSKDWTISGRYDFNQFLYAKAEQHFIGGTAILYDTQNNTGGLKPNTRLTILKAGISF